MMEGLGILKTSWIKIKWDDYEMKLIEASNLECWSSKLGFYYVANEINEKCRINQF